MSTRNKKINNILTRIIVTTFILVVFTVIFSGITITFDTLINNHVSINQMQNDNSTWMIMQVYQNVIRPTINLLSVVTVITCEVYLIINIIKFFKLKGVRRK